MVEEKEDRFELPLAPPVARLERRVEALEDLVEKLRKKIAQIPDWMFAALKDDTPPPDISWTKSHEDFYSEINDYAREHSLVIHPKIKVRKFVDMKLKDGRMCAIASTPLDRRCICSDPVSNACPLFHPALPGK